MDCKGLQDLGAALRTYHRDLNNAVLAVIIVQRYRDHNRIL